MKMASTIEPDTKVAANSIGIARSNRMFVQLAAVGECDEKGKAVFATRGYEKVIAKPDKPITTCILPLLVMLVGRCHTSSNETMQLEIDALKQVVSGLTLRG